MTTTAPVRPDSTTRPDDTARSGPAWALVARREIVVRLTDKAFVGGTLVTLLLICGFLGWQIWDSQRTATYTVATTPADRVMADRLVAGAGDIDDSVRVELAAVPDDAAAQAEVRAGDADAWLHREGAGWALTTDSEEKDGLTQVVGEVVRSATLEQQAQQLGTTAERLQAGSAVTPRLLSGDSERAGVAQGVAFVFAFLFYVASLTFGYVIANSVVEEKQSRIVEIIATSIPVRQLLAGKVIGTSALAVAQMVLYAGVGLAGLSFTPYGAVVPGLSGAVAWYLVFFVVGFVGLAALWAVAGALASRTEDVQSTGTPLLMLVLAVFFGSMFLDGTAEVVMSYVPPFSAVLMPSRLAAGTAAWWEAGVALVLLALAAVAVIRVAERLYRRSLLQTGGRLSMRQAWTAPE